MSGLNNTMVCNTSPRVYASGQMSCQVRNPTLQAIYPLDSSLTFIRTIEPDLTPLANVSSFGVAGSLYAQLHYAGVEQFYCHADSCIQELDGDNSTSAGVIWTCQDLQCTCRPDTTFCGGVPETNLTAVINSLGGTLTVGCDSPNNDTHTSSCSFKQGTLQSLFGAGGLSLDGCTFGDHDEEKPLGGGVIAGLAVVGALVFAALLVLAIGLWRQRSAKRRGPKTISAGGIAVKWHSVSYSIPPGGQFTRKIFGSAGLDEKVVLDSVSGRVTHGQMMAILGPSGAGKTTLVEILAGKNKSGGPRIGFVPQQDILPPTLTVYEALLFAAQLRLPESIPEWEKQERIEKILMKLGIDKIRDSRIGHSAEASGSKVRGISGGEMRRVSIGLELIASPDILILDEPTSGLDSVSAAKVASALHSIAHDTEHPTAVIASIHQPSSRLYQTFDTVLLLSYGRALYSGPGRSAPADYFASHASSFSVPTCPPDYNPADYLLEVASDPPVGLFQLSHNHTQTTSTITNGNGHSGNGATIRPSIEQRQSTTLTNEKAGYRDAVLAEPVYTHEPKKTASWWKRASSGSYATTFLTQLQVLCGREMKVLRRDYSLFFAHVAVSSVLGVFCGGLYYQTGITIAGFQSRVGCLFFLGALIAFSALSALYNVVETRPLFLRERSSSYYSPTAWLLSRFIFDVIPLRIIPTIIVSTITYWMAGLAPDAEHFFKFLFILVLYTLAMTLFNFLLGTLFNNGGIAILLSALSALYQMTFAGFFVHLSDIPPVLRWLQWLCPLKYTLEALCVNEVGAGLMIQDTLEGVPVNVSATLIMNMLFGFGSNNYYRDVLVFNSSGYFESDDPEFLEALQNAVLPGDIGYESDKAESSKKPATINNKRPRDEEHEPEDMDTYGPSKFGGFGEYMRRKRAKLQIQNNNIDSQSNQIFKGIAIYINGYTDPSVQVLRELIVKHGGVFQPYLDKKALVTHIITCSLTPAKIREFQHMKVVRPVWLVDSAARGVLLNWRDYVFKPGQRAEAMQGVATSQATLPKPTAVASSSKSTIQAPSRATDEPRAPGYASHRSNPNASRLMADPNWRAAHTSAAPTFIEGYYKNSRLHHLSTWKAELKKLISEAQQRAQIAPVKASVNGSPLKIGSGTSMKGSELILRSPSKRHDKGKARALDDDEKVIMHCDFDCFFVSAGLLERPQLRGQPVVVCHSQGGQGGMSSTSEIACASYEARAKGVKNGMSLQQARKLCPGVMTIPYEFEKYKEVSLKFYTVLMGYVDDLEAVSVDEALIDVTTWVRDKLAAGSASRDQAKELAERLRREVKAATGCEISVGISRNILLARLATRRAKPAGSYHLTSTEVPTFLAPLSISDLPGFGHSAKQKIEDKFKTTRLGDLLSKSKHDLSEVLGPKTGEKLWNAIRGIDDRVLESEKKRSSVSSEINYGIRFENSDQARAFIFQMAEEVSKRLKDVSMRGRSITLKIMKRDPKAPVEAPKFLGHGACDVFNKQMPIAGPAGNATDDHLVIGDHAWRLLRSFNFDPKELRGIGIHIAKLEPTRPVQLPNTRNTRLPFKPIASPPKKPAFRQPAPPPVVDPPKPEFDLPSFSQVDKSVYSVLPEDVRAELDAEYKRRSITPAAPDPNKPVLPPYKGPPGTKEAKLAAAIRKVAQELVEKSKASTSPQLHRLLSKRPKGLRKVVRMSPEELRELNIDPDIFAVLPPDIQREQVLMARHEKETGKLPAPPKKRRVIKPVFRSRLTPSMIRRLPNPQAKYAKPVFLKQRGPKKGEKLYFSETDDVQNVIEKWVNGFLLTDGQLEITVWRELSPC
ncbi:hypothetical protein ONZ45_g13687 [Pleurotus djamor]|nr:hypothetical protein ONZ45_g13687 [Pleurotus djamor]